MKQELDYAFLKEYIEGEVKRLSGVFYRRDRDRERTQAVLETLQQYYDKPNSEMKRLVEKVGEHTKVCEQVEPKLKKLQEQLDIIEVSTHNK